MNLVQFVPMKKKEKKIQEKNSQEKPKRPTSQKNKKKMKKMKYKKPEAKATVCVYVRVTYCLVVTFESLVAHANVEVDLCTNSTGDWGHGCHCLSIPALLKQ